MTRGPLSDDWSVTDDADRSRYELRRGGTLVGYATYARHNDTLVVPHVETLAEHRGHEYSEILMAGIIEDARRRSLRIDPICSHFAGYLRRRDNDDIDDIIAG